MRTILKSPGIDLYFVNSVINWEQASLTKRMLKNCVFKGTEQRVKKMPFQYRFAKQEYHLVPFLPGFHYP